MHGEVVREKDAALATLNKNYEKMAKEYSELVTLNKALDSKATVLAQKLKS